MFHFVFAAFFSLVLAACGGPSRLSVLTEADSFRGETYETKLQSPYVHGIDEESVSDSLNNRIRAFAKKIESDAVATMETPEKNEEKNTLQMTYIVEELSPSFVSILFHVSTKISGAAHGLEVTHSFNYDIAEQKELALADLFNPTSKYLDRLSELSIVQLIDEAQKNRTYYQQKEQSIKSRASAKIENFQTFSVADGKLTITFDPYDVGPYAEGKHTVTLSRAELIDVLSETGRRILSEPMQTN